MPPAAEAVERRHCRARPAIAAVILTYNSAQSIESTIRGALELTSDVLVVDSFSNDDTLARATALGAEVRQRPFVNYADQRNWAIDQAGARAPWQLHLDADEIVTPALAAEIVDALGQADDELSGFYIPRLIRFLGRELRFGGYYPIYHARLFRSGHARVEDRLYDQHFVLQGRGQSLSAPFIDDHLSSLSEWTARHNRWSDLEVADIRSATLSSEIKADRGGSPIERMRYKKNLYYRMPLFFRSISLFVYRYFLRLGLLDGSPGLIYCVLQCFWFRFLIDAKLYEARQVAAPKDGTS